MNFPTLQTDFIIIFFCNKGCPFNRRRETPEIIIYRRTKSGGENRIDLNKSSAVPFTIKGSIS